MPYSFVGGQDSSGDYILKDLSGNTIYTRAGAIQNIRTRFTIAQINSGATILAAIPGHKYRLVSCTAVAYGGAVGATTSVDIGATQTTGVVLVAYAQASLTRSAVLKDGGTGTTVLADGASYVANDVNTAITIAKTGSSLTTATGVDINLCYVIEKA